MSKSDPKPLIYFFDKFSHEIVPNSSIRVIDGDTLHLNNSEYLRLTSINSPERLTQQGKLSTSFTQQFIDDNEVLLILRLGLDKYHRTIAAVFPLSLRNDLSSLLLSLQAAEFKSYDHPFSLLYQQLQKDING